MKNKPSAVLWTGGKDCALAMHEAMQLGYEIVKLVTFAPKEANFRAHPLPVLIAQSESLEIPLQIINIQEPYAVSYEQEIARLKAEGIETLITGDIDFVANQPNWIRERSLAVGIEVLTPLWHRDRQELLNLITEHDFRIILSCVKKPWFTKSWLGDELTADKIEQLTFLNTLNGVDICGENGEYHTLALDGPMFKKRIYIKWNPVQEDNLFYLDITNIELK
ncbi:Dph6-related ATP pyrophosphatase [Solitalea koreensis]|uniref:MJ0570-related uncharacterized domain-containing protein n=1 Tax=Solitalea koreensis TaxID=543615 RepID=A0A521BRZ6_9SPHI|nr:diphthine--ammonia ligase [Solitalea koreensis]SMO49501.1 MJ0570-related uncharacterized domain-containing protein [Solitalea koreensis]